MPTTPHQSPARYIFSRCFTPLAPLSLLALLALPGPGLAADEPVLTTAFGPETASPPPQREPTRATAPAPARHLLVKALAQGSTPREAERQAVENARALAAKHLARLGGVQALFPGDEGQRIVTMRHFPALGFGEPRAVVLVELRLRGHVQAQPTAPPQDQPLLLLTATAVPGTLTLEADRPCEAVAAYLPAPGAEPELLPGGAQTFRLTPGRPLTHPLPAGLKSLDVLACTGGLLVPADPSSLDEAFTKARPGKPRPSQVEGLVSDCVELRLSLPPGGTRSMRLKGSESPVNMTGAAGRESGLPAPPKDAP
jgi:hypothetical protein